MPWFVPIAIGVAVRIAARQAAKAVARRAARKAAERAAKRRALRALRAARRARYASPQQAAAAVMRLARNPLIVGPILGALRFARSLFGRNSKARVFCNRMIGRIKDYLSRPSPNKLNHIFGRSRHNLGSFLGKFGGNQVRAYRAMQRAADRALRRQGPGRFEVDVVIKGEKITIRGVKLPNGVIKIGTAFKR